MEKTRKKRIRSIVGWSCIAILVLGLAIMPLAAAETVQEDGPQATIRSALAETGVLEAQLRFGGSLAAQDPENISLPSGVKIKSFLVKNGDRVQEGTALAEVDPVTVMEAITQIQETLSYLDTQINQVDTASGTSRLKAQTAGTVKQIYAKKGDSVRQVMLEHGALAILSLDGCMAVDIETDTPMPIGQSLTVTLETGQTVTGQVESRLGNTFIITLRDEGYAQDIQAQVFDQEGNLLGSGPLYIHNPWRLTAVSGTVCAINVTENQNVTQGKLLLTLTDTDTDAQRQMLLDQRQDYEDTMQTLFQIYQTGTVNAPCDGIVDGVDQESPLLLTAQDTQWTVTLLSAQSTEGQEGEAGSQEGTGGTPEPVPTVYSGLVALVRQGEAGELVFLTNNQLVSFFDPNTLTQEQKDPTTMTTPYAYSGGLYLYVISQGQLLLTATPASAGQLVLITEDEKLISLGSVAEDAGGNAGGMSGMVSGGSFGAMAGQSGMSMAPSFEPYDLTETTILTVTPEDTLSLEVPVDEQDIGNITLGMEASVTITALGKETYPARVTKIGTAVNSGGNSKFAVTLTLDKGENMLPGMSASAKLSLGEAECLNIPAAAVYDDGINTFVYTGQDHKTGALTNPVTVTTGLSDGNCTQILTGLEAGQQVYYTYYEAQ